MVLSSVVPEMALYGFLGAYLTGTLGFPFVVMSLLWFYNTVIAIHRNDTLPPGGVSELIIDLNFVTPSSFLLGVALGLIYLWAFQLVPLLRFEFFDVGWPRRSTTPAARTPLFVFDTRFTWFVLAGSLAGISGNFVLGNFGPEVSRGVALAIGIIGLVVGVGTILYLFYRWFSSEQPSENLDGIFALALVFIMVTPAIYDYMVLGGLRPWQLPVFLVVLFVVVLVFWLWHSWFLSNRSAEEQQLLLADVRGHSSQSSKGRIFLRWAVLYINLFIIYLVGGLVDNSTAVPVPGAHYEAGNVRTVATVVFLTCLVLAIIGLIIGYVRWRSDAWRDYWVTRSDEQLLEPDQSFRKNTGAAPAVRASAAAFVPNVYDQRGERAISAARSQLAESSWGSSALGALRVGQTRNGLTKRV